MDITSDGNDVVEMAVALFKNLVFNFALRVSHSISESNGFRIRVACAVVAGYGFWFINEVENWGSLLQVVPTVIEHVELERECPT